MSAQATECCATRRYPGSDQAARLFKALGDETRLTIIRQLAEQGSVCACDLGACCDLAQPTVSHHLKVLREAGLVTTEKQGQWIFFALRPGLLGELRAWLADAPPASAALSGPHCCEQGEPMSASPTVKRVRRVVREHYATAARRVVAQGGASCCASDRCCSSAKSFYDLDELAALPDTAANASFGCGNPTLLAHLQPGEVVLDLGSGAGLDVLLSAKRVAPTGKAYGLDMTDDMLTLARSNASEAGVANVEFLKGHIEAIPLPDASVDVIISNCVINLSADKDAVLAEAFRVLRPGGRLAVTDIVVRGAPLTSQARQALSLWAECVTGALTEAEYAAKLETAGFEAVALETIKVYGPDDLPRGEGATPIEALIDPDSEIVSAFVRALKPSH